ncbi:Uncharacterised protein [Mycobacterium tuberculosis]|nr:Uncharacterised protein [Mycobacterium tuberculosis]
MVRFPRANRPHSARSGGHSSGGEFSRFTFQRLINNILAATQGPRSLAPLRRQDDVHHGPDKHEGGRERIDPDAGNKRGGIVTQQLNTESPGAVESDIEPKQSPVADDEPAVNVDQCDEYQNIPDQFVEERWLHDERHLTRRDAVQRIRDVESGGVPAVEDLQTPRHSGFPAVELLIEVVSEPTDSLRQHDTRRHRIKQDGQRDSTTPAANPRAHDTKGYRTPDAQAPIPDSQCRGQPGTTVTEICPPVGSQVIEPAANQAERHGPQGDVVGHAALAAAGCQPAIPDQQCDNDAGDNANCVGADG